MEDKFLVISDYGDSKIIDEHTNHSDAWKDYKNEVRDAEACKKLNIHVKVSIAKVMESFNNKEEK